MYQPQQQGAPFNRPRNMPYHQQQPGHSMGGNNMAQMNSYQAGQFPPQTRLPEELESAISVRVQGGRDEDHRLLNQNTQIPRQHCVDPRMHGDGRGGSSETAYSNSNNLVSLSCDDQQNHMQDVDWSNYQTPSKLFGLNQQQHLQQSSHSHANPNSGHSGGGMQSWNAPVSQPARPQGGNMQGLYVPESAGSILAGFGLSNDDLEVLSHYPDDQLTPDTLPFILRDIQIHKTNRNTGPPAFSQTLPAIPNLPPPLRLSPPQRHPAHSCPTNIPTFLSVTQTAGKVIDYGHASRAAEEGRDSYKRELPSKERATKPESKSTGSSLKRKAESPRRHDDSSDSKKDKDYRRRAPIPDTHKHKRTPVREPPSRSRLEREGSRSRPQFEARSESSKSTRPSGAKRSSSTTKRLPTPTMIGDFSADPPKVYPHTCSLCDMQCERAKDWIDHVNTVNHTASCRDLRNKYPDWNPNVPRRDPSQGQDASATWQSLERSPSRSVSRSLSWSPSPTPPPDRSRRISPPTSHGHAPHTSGRHSPSQSHRGSASSAHRPEKRTSESSGISTGSSSREGLKRSRNDPAKCATGHGNRAGVSGKHESGKRESYLSSTSKFPASMSEKPHRPSSSASSKPGAKPAAGKETALGQDSELQSSSAPQKKPNPTQQKKNPPGSYLLYLSGLPVDAKYQEVVSLVQSFGKVTNVLIIRNEEGDENQGQPQYSKATVCMQKEQDAKALAECLTLTIREHPISVSDQNGEGELTSSIPVIIKGEVIGAPKTPAAPNEANLTVKVPEASVGQKNSNEIHREQVKPQRKRKRGCRAGQLERLKRLQRENKRGMVKITGLPESGCSEVDIAKLAQPFGTPVKILLITKPSEALVTMQDVETAQEMVKVYTDMPVCINDSVLNMSLLPNLLVDFNRPVALFHSLMGPRNPVSEVGGDDDDDWNRLLVVSNIPATPSGPTEIQNLVQRFGTVQQTLALKDKIIFEMGTADMAKSVFNRFQKFPCIVQNNKLAFSWKPDPKTDLPKVDISSAGSTASTDGNDSQTAETTMPPGGQEDSLSQSGLKVESGTGVDTKVEGQEVQPGNEGMNVEEGVQATKSPALGGKDSEKEPDASPLQPAGVNQREPGGQGGEVVTEKVVDISTTESEEPVSSDATSAPQAAKPETENMSVSSSTTATPAPKVMAAIIEALRQESRNRSSTRIATNQAAAENPPGKQPKDKETPDVQAAPALPRVTPEILKVLLEECRIRSTSRAGAEQARKEQAQAPPAGQKPSTGNRRDHSGDREPGREQATKRKTREEEREERETARRERERRMKTQEEEKEKGRREREKRRSHRERSSGSPGSRSSMRYEGSRHSGKSGARSESRRGNGEEKQQEEEELGEKHVPFDMEDFVTVDEVGEAAAVPLLPETTTEVTVNDPVTTASEAEQQAPADTTSMELEGEPGTAKVREEALDKREQKEEGLSPSTTEGSVKTAEGPGDVTEETFPDCQDDIKEPVVTVPKTTCDEVTEESTTTDSPGAAGEEERDGQVEGLNMGTFLTVDEVGRVEEDGEKRTAQNVESKRRRTSQEEREEETARRKMKMDPLFYKDYSIPPFNPDSPVGMEFLVPKSGFFCKVCSKFYSGTGEAEKNHCKTLKHHQNLEKSLEKWRVKKD